MVNIISKSYCSRVTGGPKKVADNLIKGLEKINYPYAVNRRLDACERLWIHDDIPALKQLKNLPPGIKVVVGPNLFVVPRQIPAGVDLSRAVYLHPSRWAAEVWQRLSGFSACPVEVWPVGIDTDEFKPSASKKKYALVYFKQRFAAELEFVTRELNGRNIAYKIINYPRYKEHKYKNLLAEARYVIWLGRQESQGLALLEALSSGVPMIVCDVSRLGHWQASAKEMAVFNQQENNFTGATSAAYFDDSCGIKIKNLNELPPAIEKMEKSLAGYGPRQYILKNLSLEKQARDFLNVYQRYFGLTFEQGLKEKLLRPGYWQNASLRFRAGLLARDGAKILLRSIL